MWRRRGADNLREMDESGVLIDGRSGLHVSWYFWLRVLDEVNRAMRYGTPFGLLLLEAEVRAGAPARASDEAAARVGETIRSTDLGGRLASGRVGVLLPHQDLPSAERAVARIVGGITKQGSGEVGWRTKLLSYPGDGAEISKLLTTEGSDRSAVAGAGM